jgi:hypothetical protein
MEKRIIEGIEACRPGSEDLHSPELSDVARAVQQDPDVRALYERVQKWDAAISSSIDQVPVPQGLAERILDRLRLAAAAPASQEKAALLNGVAAAATSNLAVSSAPVDRVQKTSSRWSRRQWLAGFASIAATLLIAAFLSSWLPSGTDVPLEEIAQGWSDELGADWQDIERSPREFAVPAAVLASPTAWQWIGSHAAGGGVAYRLQDKNGRQAMLFVVRMSRPGLPSAAPVDPQSNTAGKAVGYWQSGQLVYVLVVPGDERNYRTFVSSSPPPLA